MTERQKHILKITEAKKQLKTAGSIHARDLKKYIHRMEKMLIQYDKFQSGSHL